MPPERDKNGRFVKGYKGGPGRPPKQREERFYEITLATCTFKDWELIIKKAVTQAKRGNKDARKFLADYLIGPPAQTHDLRGPGAGGAHEILFKVLYGEDGTSDPPTEAA